MNEYQPISEIKLPAKLIGDVEMANNLDNLSSENLKEVSDYFILNFDSFLSSNERLRFLSSIINKSFSIRASHRDCYVELFKRVQMSIHEFDRLKVNYIKQSLWEDKGRLLRFLVDANVIRLEEIPFHNFMPRRTSKYFFDIFDLDTVPDNFDMLEIEIKYYKDPKYNEIIHFGYYKDTIEYAIITDNVDRFLEIVGHDEKLLSLEKIPELLNLAAFYGSLTIFKHLLVKYEIDFSLDTFKEAIKGGNLELISIVYEKMQDELNESKISELFPICIKYHRNQIFDWIVSQNNNLSKKIIEPYFIVNKKRKALDHSEIQEVMHSIEEYSIMNRNIPSTIFSIKYKNEYDDSHEFLTHIKKTMIIAAENGDINFLKFLTRKFQPNLGALMGAVHNNNIEIVKYLHSLGLDICGVYLYYRQAFVEAVSNPFCSKELVEYLLENNVSTTFNEDRETPYIRKGDRKMRTLLDIARDYGNTDVIEVLSRKKT
ncbi:hypothetical protein TRFO_41529 [Tritrichomonas foetus]|uniref:DUF3447 domain-containing protein n=1 Tax=Tritrichomonas foetus TaxID=1144522 RepID=A0A1J4L4F1_9EUKA|nr:hypothetical protein TRFO_41529 [Tritrichomonas foetus]|eukprot:OHT16852.1 hypothetical protein TRFO_41529 [Tritrichomonas foetus]